MFVLSDCFLFSTLSVLHSLIITVISLTVIPFINCTFNLASFPLYPQSFCFILRQPIYSLAFLLCFRITLQYCNDKIVSKSGFNFSLNTSNDPVLVLHFSFSPSFRVCTNLSPSWPKHFNIIGTQSLSCVLQLLLRKIFITSISKMHSS